VILPEQLVADHELTDAEIVERFGKLFAEAERVFAEDPSYVVRIAEVAARQRERRASHRRDPGRTAAATAASAENRAAAREAREAEILALRAQGLTTAQIAEAMGLAPSTVGGYLRRAPEVRSERERAPKRVAKPSTTSTDRTAAARAVVLANRADVRAARIEEIARLRREGRTLDEIASETGLAPSTVGGYLYSRRAPAVLAQERSEREAQRAARDERIVRLRSFGLTHREIAAEVGLGETRVKTILRGAGAGDGRVRSAKWDRRDAQIKDLSEKGLSGVEIGRMLGLSKGTVSLRLKAIREADTPPCDPGNVEASSDGTETDLRRGGGRGNDFVDDREG